ncbi:MAG TPA: hypothetical protein VFW53_00475 [Gallionella sp.]|nr:hypothetical protein [Gallionella sp.]
MPFIPKVSPKQKKHREKQKSQLSKLAFSLSKSIAYVTLGERGIRTEKKPLPTKIFLLIRPPDMVFKVALIATNTDP